MIKSKRYTNKEGFTLIEVMIVLFIIGLLASIALPGFINLKKAAKTRAFSRDLKTFMYAAEAYAMETGYWIPATTPGVFPPELDGYFSKTVFETDTSIGGQWITTFGENPVWSGFGIVNPTVDEDHLVMIDQTIDDGNLNTGTFRKVGAESYYYILEEH